MEGEIVAAGPGARNEQGVIVPLEVKAGDRVLFGKWSGTEVKLDGEELPDHERKRPAGRHRRRSRPRQSRLNE